MNNVNITYMVNKLYWSKYRPKNIDGMILLPRIAAELYPEGKLTLSNNYLLTGTPGLGKTTLAKIIVPKDALIVNASYNSSVDDLREHVTEYVRTSDIFGSSSIDNHKIVFLDEFDGVSAKYQEALRAFIEDYEGHVRFIATCNNLNKVSSAMQSRFTVIDFNPKNSSEIKFLKDGYIERCELIREMNNIQISDGQIKSLVDINFPDMRSILNTLQRATVANEYVEDMNSSLNVDLYNLIFNKIEEDKTYNWVMENYGDNVEPLLKMCGRSLAEYIINNKPALMGKLPALTETVARTMNELSTTPDPFLLGISCIYNLQKTINS